MCVLYNIKSINFGNKKEIDRDYAQKLAALSQQIEKVDEAYKKDLEKLHARQEDLDKQLESMLENM